MKYKWMKFELMAIKCFSDEDATKQLIVTLLTVGAGV